MLNLPIKMMNNIPFIASALLLLALLHQCQVPSEVQQKDVNFVPDQVPYPFLSEYAFFQGTMTAQLPNEGVIPYAPSTPLFTDYAHKARFVWMPDSVMAAVSPDGTILFPENTVLIKSFYYPADFRQPAHKREMMETRLLIKRKGQWEAFTYVWDAEGTDARLNLVGDIRPVEWLDEKGASQSVDYVVPNKNQCKSCHNQAGELLPIGTKVSHLNAAYQYGTLATNNQVQYWQGQKILQAGDWDHQFPATPQWEASDTYSLTERALAYLDVNCGHCHHPSGSAHTTGLYMGLAYEKELEKLGVCKPPVAAGKGSGGHRYSIVPGQPDSSILVYRMASDDPGIMMPEIGRGIAHKEGLALIREWIGSLEGKCR